MKEYEISFNNKQIGKINLFKGNLNKNIKNSLIISCNNIQYEMLNYKTELQQYEVIYNLNSIDDLYDIVSRYKYNEKEIFEEIDNIKKYNNLKSIKKNTNIKIVIPEIYLNNLSIDKKNINLNSLIESKIFFIYKVLENIKLDNIKNDINSICFNYNNLKNSNEYEFLTDEEKSINFNKYIAKIDKLVDYIENNTNYKYERDFIKPIIIDKN